MEIIYFLRFYQIFLNHYFNYLTENFTEEEKNQLIKLLNKVYENLLKGDINESKK